MSESGWAWPSDTDRVNFVSRGHGLRDVHRSPEMYHWFRPGRKGVRSHCGRYSQPNFRELSTARPPSDLACKTCFRGWERSVIR